MELKKLGSNLEIKGMIIHQLSKVANNRNVGFKKAKKELVIGDKEQLFIGKLSDSYHKKSNPTYGIFAGINTSFKDNLKTYLNDDLFYNFSVLAAEKYKTVLEDTISATGGFLIFADYINLDSKNRYMLVLTINNKDGYVVSENDLTIKDTKNLDLSKVDIACLINLTRWETTEEGEDLESKTYLSFVKGNKNVSYYFLNFIDCDNKTTNTESSKRLVNAIEAFAINRGFDRKTKIKLKNIVYDHCAECIKDKKDIQLSTISALLDPENVYEFQEFAASEEFGVSETIKGDRAQLKRIKYVIYKGDGYNIEFDTNLLGKDVIYNKAKNELTFKRVPEALVSQLPS